MHAGQYSVQFDQVAILLSTEAHHSFVPLFEIVVKHATVQLQCNAPATNMSPSTASFSYVLPGDVGGIAGDGVGAVGPGSVGAAARSAAAASQAMSRVAAAVHVGVGVHVDVFNVEKMGWEPMIDPWNVHVSMFCLRAHTHAPSSTAQVRISHCIGTHAFSIVQHFTTMQHCLELPFSCSEPCIVRHAVDAQAVHGLSYDSQTISMHACIVVGHLRKVQHQADRHLRKMHLINQYGCICPHLCRLRTSYGNPCFNSTWPLPVPPHATATT